MATKKKEKEGAVEEVAVTTEATNVVERKAPDAAIQVNGSLPVDKHLVIN